MTSSVEEILWGGRKGESSAGTAGLGRGGGRLQRGEGGREDKEAT